MIRGGDGDDIITAGKNAESTSIDGQDFYAAYHYLYGDRGNDRIWGEDKTGDQKIWGGEGHDWLVGGDNTKGDQWLFGNEGNDTIKPGSGAETKVIAKGGKGWDIINPVDEAWPANNAVGNVEERFEGGDGEDIIFGG